MNSIIDFDDTICAISSPAGEGAIAIIRLTGEKAVEVASQFVNFNNNKLHLLEHSVAKFGYFKFGNETIDEIMVIKYLSPNSYTGQDLIEIFCHGSIFIQQRILQILISNGARIAKPGEFTQRAFMNGKMDLSQAEAVADLISSRNKMAHNIAMRQMKGEFSSKLNLLRENLIKFTSLIELELDFSEEDIEFVDRSELKKLLLNIDSEVQQLIKSYEYGNAIKNGIPVAIVGEPNVGKSTLLNILLKEDRAIVSDIEGTTRDSIEDTMVINGYEFRFIDTAGIRESVDTIESKGIERTLGHISKAKIVLLLFDARSNESQINATLKKVKNNMMESSSLLLVANKIDLLEHADKNFQTYFDDTQIVGISAIKNRGVDQLIELLLEKGINDIANQEHVVVSNIRHLDALQNISSGIKKVEQQMADNISGDLLTFEIKEILQHIGNITGQSITTDDVLSHIFKNFCVGK